MTEGPARLRVVCRDEEAHTGAVRQLVDDRFASRIADQDPSLWGGAAEEEAALSHAPVDPDTSAAYGDGPDQVVDFYAPRGGAEV